MRTPIDFMMMAMIRNYDGRPMCKIQRAIFFDNYPTLTRYENGLTPNKNKPFFLFLHSINAE